MYDENARVVPVACSLCAASPADAGSEFDSAPNTQYDVCRAPGAVWVLTDFRSALYIIYSIMSWQGEWTDNTLTGACGTEDASSVVMGDVSATRATNTMPTGRRASGLGGQAGHGRAGQEWPVLGRERHLRICGGLKPNMGDTVPVLPIYRYRRPARRHPDSCLTAQGRRLPSQISLTGIAEDILKQSAYVDTELVGKGTVSKAAIVGQQGGIWAISPDYKVCPLPLLRILEGCTELHE